MTTITAKYAGRCDTCGQAFPAGAPVLWAKGRKPVHAVCPPLVVAPAVAPMPAMPMMPPPFPPAAGAAEGFTDRGLRAVLYLLTHGALGATTLAVGMLDDDTVEAAYHAAGVAATGRQLPADIAETLAGLQAELRGAVARRQRDRAERDQRLQALFDAADGQTPSPAPIVVPEASSQAGGASSQGGGGSKVPAKPKPGPVRPSDGAALTPARPVLAPALAPPVVLAPAGVAAADDLF